MREIDVRNCPLNPLTAFSEDWMALAAGNEELGYNAMTVAWGHLGSVWGCGSHTNRLPTATCFVRPSRHTKKFMDREEFFTLSHFGREERGALGYLGSHSGRDGDKVAAAGLTPVFEDGTVYFAEADVVLVCRKLYAQDLVEEGFADAGLVEYNYPERDFHTMYIGEIVQVLVRD
ncbi:flavin reductase [Paratractidigestivibacter sp.]|uniref:flavin reductase n=1 Tax=Paratractidigestivibacter sp. TaxID=2847316 RepID=UPI002ABE94E2|nr:flavin reductase [Paratractidigestivibacter sp.]